jgi:GNAT superfamily N-acetyltransferase
MQTGLEDDYMLRVWERISSGENNRLFGLFAEEQLASVAGYTIYAKENAMLGRLRSDVRFRGKSFATTILRHAMEKALENPNIRWISANTEQHNIAAQKVLKKIGLPPVITLYGAETENLSPLLTGEIPWQEIDSYEEQLNWIKQTYLNDSFEKAIFPYESHYPFPARPGLFLPEYMKEWKFYQNQEKTRYVILWEEFKGDYLLHVTYPFDDFHKQRGLWETVNKAYQNLLTRHQNSYVWIDFTPEETKKLPDNHPFELPSPWMLHGKSREDFFFDEEVNGKLQEAHNSLDALENELEELTKEIEEKTRNTNELLNRLDEID